MGSTHLPLYIFDYRPYGLPTRQLELKCRITNPSTFSICILDAWVKIEALNGLLIAEGNLILYMHNEVDAAVIKTAKQGLASIMIPLPVNTLQQIEQRREGKDLTLQIFSRVRACPLYAQDEKQVLGAPFATQFDDGHTGFIEYTISQSDWIKALRGLGWSELELIEIPSTKIAKLPHLSRAYKRFEDALEFYRRGDWEETMVNCRKAFEAIIKDTTGKDKITKSVAETTYRELITDPDKAVLINEIANSLTPFLHLGRHEKMPPVPIKPKDAILAIHFTGSMLAYLADN